MHFFIIYDKGEFAYVIGSGMQVSCNLPFLYSFILVNSLPWLSSL